MVNQLTTYAQNREDLYLYGILHEISKGFYVDVGANHEKLHSVTRLFYDLGWKGINIEPNPKLIREFKRYRRRDINIQCGVSDKKGELIFREYPDYDGLSTVSDEIKKINEGHNMAYHEYPIQVKTLRSIFKENRVKVIDYLKIDIEGHELFALKGNDWKKYRPKVVLFEGTKGKECIEFLKKQNYTLEFFDGLNYYMIDKKQNNLTIHDYAGAVLTKGIFTLREKRIQENVKDLEKIIAKIPAEQQKILQTTIENGVGIKNSLKSLKKSIIRRLKSRL